MCIWMAPIDRDARTRGAACDGRRGRRRAPSRDHPQARRVPIGIDLIDEK
jgi:hypothetical protein